MPDTATLAIVNNVKTNRKLIAVCEHRTYDVLGNSRDGYEVNDSFNNGEIEIPAEMTVSNVPRVPGASDRFRSFPVDSNSFSCEVSVSFHMTDSAIKSALGIRCKIEIEGDDQTYYVSREKDAYPICELLVVRFEELEV